MKRAAGILLVIGVTAVITWLAVSNHFLRERASRLDQALADAEARVMQLEVDIDNVNQRLAVLSTPPVRPASSRPTTNRPPATDQAAPAAPVPGTSSFADRLRSPVGQPPSRELLGIAGVAVAPLRFNAVSGRDQASLVRIEGTSSIHNWQVEGHLIGGSAQFDPGFARLQGGLRLETSTNTQVKVFVPVRSLKSVEADGRPYSDRMDEIMYEQFRDGLYPRITFTLTSLALKEQLAHGSEPYVYDATGELGVAGVTNTVAFPVTASARPDGIIKLSGSFALRMTDFKITPPAPAVGGGVIKTGDDVTVRFVWWVKQTGTLEAAR